MLSMLPVSLSPLCRTSNLSGPVATATPGSMPPLLPPGRTVTVLSTKAISDVPGSTVTFEPRRSKATAAPYYWAPFVLIGDPGEMSR